ncbi:hypothetical protein FA13DRAFT_1715771 [Coprinellus micaceus]|uniref:Uncharacterized protein n=1 Tax=Coprinellus micaceus TaxID=71717 RepID=A0A4Y7SLU0_COPMI|nr:hypothetical protein FA13DRAFT_1715771 [Coprinellus micaceus]
MSSDSAPSLGLTVTSLADGTSIIERSLPTDFFLELDGNILVVNRHEENKTSPIEFYTRTLMGTRNLGCLCRCARMGLEWKTAIANAHWQNRTPNGLAGSQAPCHAFLHPAGEQNDSPAARDARFKASGAFKPGRPGHYPYTRAVRVGGEDVAAPKSIVDNLAAVFGLPWNEGILKGGLSSKEGSGGRKGLQALASSPPNGGTLANGELAVLGSKAQGFCHG